MFTDAGRLLMISSGRKLHAISYSWKNFEPQLIFFDPSTSSLLQQDMHNLAFHVTSMVQCVGSFRDGAYRPCPFSKVLEYGEQCEFCSRSLIPIRRCLFDPICDGHICDWHLCKRPHAVYIAFYGTKIKVGMTSTARLEERLIEQGADAYFQVTTAPNRMEARSIERRISAEAHIAQLHRFDELLPLFYQEVDWKGIEQQYTALSERLGSKMGMQCGPLRFLENYPITLPIRERISPVSIEGMHEGEVLGIKGRFLLYRHAGVRAINMPVLSGRFVTTV
ncbi:MAG: DUF2797 domain-containing protein [Methanomassiliicoccales archaeon]